ncbi:fasciclin domain-containing protein [Sciscionella marina]|uniref:fasciclin domain-containing protein n=1 Tax=Sciscionella marina TaxID=508770 RepID=UPI000381DC00|nr:fasciclin domain-containing protein [Sciscionella marina]
MLQYHAVGKRISPNQLNNGTFTSLTGQLISPGGSCTSFTVNDNAKIICGNVRAANTVVYILDGVLTPSS